MRSVCIFLTLSVLAFAQEGTLKWEYKSAHRWNATSPAIGMDGTVYFVSTEGYYAFDPDGTLKWQARLGVTPSTSPAIGKDGTIYFVGALRDTVQAWTGYIFALAPDGTEKWRYRTDDYIYCSPAVGSDGTVYCGSDDRYLYALNPDGTLKWRFETGDKVFKPSAIASNGIIYFGSADKYLYALNPDGSLLWKYQPNRGSICASLAIDSDGTIYFGTGGSCYLYAVSPDGTLKWRIEVGGVVSSPTIGADGTIYFGTKDCYLYAIDPYEVDPDSMIKWRFKTDGPVSSSSPTVGADGTIYIGEGNHDHALYAINPDSTLRWKFDNGGDVISSPAIGDDGTVYFVTTDGYFKAVTSSSKGLADSPWPKYQHDNFNSGSVDGGVAVKNSPLPSSADLYVSSAVISDKLSVNFTLPQGQDGRIAVYNVVGQRLEQVRVTSSGEVEFKRVFPKGVYLLRLESGGSSATAKAVIMR